MKPNPEELILVMPGIAMGAELTAMADALEVRTYRDGDVICRQGDAGGSAFLVARGNIDVRVGRAKSRIAVLRRGQMFGQMSLVDGHLRSATCRAVGDVMLYELTGRALQELGRNSAEMAARLLWRIARQLAASFRAADELLGRVAVANPWLDLSTVPRRDTPDQAWKDHRAAIGRPTTPSRPVLRPPESHPVPPPATRPAPHPAPPPLPVGEASFEAQIQALSRNLADVDLDRVRVVSTYMTQRPARVRPA